MKCLLTSVSVALLLQSLTSASAQSSGTAVSPAGNRNPSDAAAATTAGVFDCYFKIQSALAHDSLRDVSENAWAMAELVRQDRAGVFRGPAKARIVNIAVTAMMGAFAAQVTMGVRYPGIHITV